MNVLLCTDRAVHNSVRIIFMKTVKHYTWLIEPVNTPFIRKKCSKCNCSTLFYCSNKFRLNSQKKYIDVWLIYRCEDCDTTYNLTILSRTKPHLIDKELYRKFSENDESLAWKYTFDRDILRRNNVEPDFSNFEYNIMHESILLSDIPNMKVDRIDFRVQIEYHLPIRLDTIIRKCLGISTSQLDRMLDIGLITMQPDGTDRKHKVRNDMQVILHCENLQKYLQG